MWEYSNEQILPGHLANPGQTVSKFAKWENLFHTCCMCKEATCLSGQSSM